MIKSSCLVTFLSLFFSQLPLAKASEENLKLVTSTGRAAFISDEQIQETRSRALEDALYSAALLGTFSTTTSGSNVLVQFTSVNTSTTVKFIKQVITT